VTVPIIVEGHRFDATFVRLPDGTVSEPAMNVAGLADTPNRVELEREFWEAARRVRAQKHQQLDALLVPATHPLLEAIDRDVGELADQVRDEMKPVVDEAKRVAARVHEEMKPTIEQAKNVAARLREETKPAVEQAKKIADDVRSRLGFPKKV
jgi:ElaB/YqjD/DUF883 family membrane-anchored ribosome-binding protein